MNCNQSENRIAVGVVVFNSDDLGRFRTGVQSMLMQVERLYVFDNSTEKLVCNLPDSVVYITEHENKGIAFALNSNYGVIR